MNDKNTHTENTSKKNIDLESLPETWQTACNTDEYCKFDESGYLTVQFKTNSFVEEVSTYGVQNVFMVSDSEGLEMKFATSSKRCMQALAQHFPIKDKILEIVRTGEKMDTSYAVTQV